MHRIIEDVLLLNLQGLLIVQMVKNFLNPVCFNTILLDSKLACLKGQYENLEMGVCADVPSGIYFFCYLDLCC
jgi:hypothetical protein